MNTCIQCGEKHDKRGAYCSKKCTDKAYRDRKSGKANALPIIDRTPKKKIVVNVPKETGPKLKWCNFCGASLNESTMLQFCNGEHQRSYYETISLEGTLKLRIDSRTTIETKKYDRVQQLIESMMTRNSFLTLFS